MPDRRGMAGKSCSAWADFLADFRPKFSNFRITRESGTMIDYKINQETSQAYAEKVDAYLVTHLENKRISRQWRYLKVVFGRLCSILVDFRLFRPAECFVVEEAVQEKTKTLKLFLIKNFSKKPFRQKLL